MREFLILENAQSFLKMLPTADEGISQIITNHPGGDFLELQILPNPINVSLGIYWRDL